MVAVPAFDDLENLAGLTLSGLARSRLSTYVELLQRWQNAQNLVGPDTLEAVWHRHILDSLQLIPLIDRVMSPAAMMATSSLAGQPEGGRDERWSALAGIDFGSGAGLPGLVLALATADRTDSNGAGVYSMNLVESNARKAAFLRAVSRETGVPIRIWNNRIEALAATPVSFLTARALAPLPRLVALTDPWLRLGATAFFHKGVESGTEQAAWTDAAAYSVVEHRSCLHPESRILQIERLPHNQGGRDPREPAA